jgi:hypothetical protein
MVSCKFVAPIQLPLHVLPQTRALPIAPIRTAQVFEITCDWRTHNPKVAGSNPAPATKPFNRLRARRRSELVPIRSRKYVNGRCPRQHFLFSAQPAPARRSEFLDGSPRAWVRDRLRIDIQSRQNPMLQQFKSQRGPRSLEIRDQASTGDNAYPAHNGDDRRNLRSYGRRSILIPSTHRSERPVMKYESVHQRDTD